MSNTWTYTLRRGHAADPNGGACAMDAVNWLVHGKHGDKPACACPVIGRYVIGLNDMMPHDQRQRLLAYLHRIAGSRSPAHEQVRAEILARGAVRVLAPLALDVGGLTAEAGLLLGLPADCTMDEAARAALAAEKAARAAAAAAAAAVAAARAAAAKAVVTAAAVAAAVVTAKAVVAAWVAAKPPLAAEKAARAAAAAARAAEAAAWAQRAAAEAALAAQAAGPAAWDAALALLDEALSAGPQGEPWSAVQVDAGMAAYRAAGGRVTA